MTSVTETPCRCAQPPQSRQVPDPAHAVLSLHGAIGNQAVQRLLRSGGVQPKLAVTQPGDPYEREADRVADQVLQKPEPAVEGKLVQGHGPSPQIQRMCGPCREEEETIQRKEFPSAAAETTPAAKSNAFALPRAGHALPESARAFFEPRFGYDFSRVRLHTDPDAAESAQAVNALAYTVGRDVVFGAGQYAPHTSRGRHLLAHELTHVVQQGGRGTSPDTALQARLSKEVHENQADTFANTANGQARSGYNVVVDPQPDGDTPPRGDCSGWEIDHVSFSINVARHYVQTEMDPEIAKEARSVTCRDGNYPRASDCKVTFSGNVTIRVGFVPSKREVHAWNTTDKGDWLCMYNYDCTESGELVLSKIRCVQIASATMTAD